jgi:hypothetical protein
MMSNAKQLDGKKTRCCYRIYRIFTVRVSSTLHDDLEDRIVVVVVVVFFFYVGL